MQVVLKDLKPNPFRDFAVDPIEPERVAVLTQSIKDDGFWGGVSCRERSDGVREIAAGHHRVDAAIAAGIKTAELFVSKQMDDDQMIRIYGRENSTQRGNSSQAVAGTVAAAIRRIAKVLFIGGKLFDQFVEKYGLAIRKDERGIGPDPVVKFLGDLPGINNAVVRQQLALLKDSGDYARIITEVQSEIEREQKEQLEALARAEKARREAEEREAAAREREEKAEEERKEAQRRAKAARDEDDRRKAETQRREAEAREKKAKQDREQAEQRRRDAEADEAKHADTKRTRDTAKAASGSAAKHEVAFDIRCNQVFKNPSQLDTFRKIVSKLAQNGTLPVKSQLALAKALVVKAKKLDREVTSSFIREEINAAVMDFRRKERELTKEEERRAAEDDFRNRWKQKEVNFCRAVRFVASASQELIELDQKRPKNLATPITGEFRESLKLAKKVIDQLNARL